MSREVNITYGMVCNRLLSALLPKSIIDILSVPEFGNFQTIFGSAMYNYDRADNQISDMPALCIYPLAANNRDPMMFLEGTLGLKVLFSLDTIREGRTEVGMVTLEYLLTVLQSRQFRDQLLIPIPWLVKFAWNTRYSYGGIQQQKDGDVIVATGSIDYTVDKQKFYVALEQAGVEVDDPCTDVQSLITTYLIDDENINLTP